MIRSKINSKHVFGLGAMLVLLTAVLFWQASVREGQAQSVGGFNHAILTVRMDNNVSLSSLASGAASGNAMLTAGGVLFSDVDLTRNRNDDQEVGRIRIWGISRTDTVFKNIATGEPTTGVIATVNVNIELPGFNGTLEGQGTLSDVVNDGLHGHVILTPSGPATLDGDDVIAITGGTGGFRGANGEALIHDNLDGTFTITLQEAKRR